MTTDNIGIMAREKRRERILAALGATAEPQSAGALGDRFGVSRQVIVQDIAVLRQRARPSSPQTEAIFWLRADRRRASLRSFTGRTESKRNWNSSWTGAGR